MVAFILSSVHSNCLIFIHQYGGVVTIIIGKKIWYIWNWRKL